MLGRRSCNLELINSCLQCESEYWKSVSSAQRVYLSDVPELGISHGTIMKNLLWRVIKGIEPHEVLSDFFCFCDRSGFSD